MTINHLRVADLSQEAIDSIQSLEEELDAHILALEPQVTLRDLNASGMEKLRALEEALGVVLIAYEPI